MNWYALMVKNVGEEEAEAELTCSICLFKKVNAALLPCGHVQYCVICLQSLNDCMLLKSCDRADHEIYNEPMVDFEISLYFSKRQ